MKNKTEFIETLTQLLAIKSYKQQPTRDMPFGKGAFNALDYFLSSAKKMGFNTINYENYLGEVYYGQGEEIGIIGHLDVVPEGDGWDTDPYTLTKKDGKLFARGILDDKAPILLCLFALKELKEEGIKFNKKIRLFVGTNEESGWGEIKYFKSKYENTKYDFPKWGFSPDGNFPVSYAEKGPNEITFEFPYKSDNFYGFKGGNVVNAVCNYASVYGKIDEDLLKKHNLKHTDNFIESFGKAAHGSIPHLGKNAILPILEYMKDLGEDVDNIIKYLFKDELNITKIGNETGYATLSPDLISQDNDKLIITADFRVPAKMLLEDFLPLFDKINVKYNAKKNRDPLYVAKDSELVTNLINAYNEVTKENVEPMSLGGATFASVFDCGVAFGPEMPDEVSTIHEPNEFMYEKDIEIMYEIYKKAIYSLIK